ncbi:MAG: hypothetical protein ISP41_16470 [Alphaproteobacteria bacterium]|nr:hypothetical protein [Alphaproteobacteria bacterium]
MTVQKDGQRRMIDLAFGSGDEAIPRPLQSVRRIWRATTAARAPSQGRQGGPYRQLREISSTQDHRRHVSALYPRLVTLA